MKLQSILFLSAVAFTNLTYGKLSMQKFETLVEFESLYDAIKPAQENSEEAFVWLSQIPHPFFNAVMHLSSRDVEARVDALIKQTPSHRSLSFWLHPENRAEGLSEILEERNFKSLITCPLMAWHVEPQALSACDIRSADTEIFYEIISHVYQLTEEEKREFQKLMETVACENYIVYEDGNAVGTGTLFINGQVGGIFNDATLPERREASLAMMQFLMLQAHERDLKKLVVLSSPEAEDLYAKLGFVSVFNIEVFTQ